MGGKIGHEVGPTSMWKSIQYMVSDTRRRPSSRRLLLNLRSAEPTVGDPFPLKRNGAVAIDLVVFL